MCRTEHENVGAIARRADSDCEESMTLHRLVSYRMSQTTRPNSVLKRPSPRRKRYKTREPWLYLTIPMLPIINTDAPF